MGKHTIAERTFRGDPSVRLHAPLRVLVDVDPAAVTNLAIEQPGTLFDSYANPDVSAVGHHLDRLLSRRIALLGEPIPPELSGEPALSD